MKVLLDNFGKMATLVGQLRGQQARVYVRDEWVVACPLTRLDRGEWELRAHLRRNRAPQDATIWFAPLRSRVEDHLFIIGDDEKVAAFATDPDMKYVTVSRMAMKLNRKIDARLSEFHQQLHTMRTVKC